ncbi:hypothetical protein WDW86_21510 [Bdellovibrionota bacterium FG-2]
MSNRFKSVRFLAAVGVVVVAGAAMFAVYAGNSGNSGNSGGNSVKVERAPASGVCARGYQKTTIVGKLYFGPGGRTKYLSWLVRPVPFKPAASFDFSLDYRVFQPRPFNTIDGTVVPFVDAGGTFSADVCWQPSSQVKNFVFEFRVSGKSHDGVLALAPCPQEHWGEINAQILSQCGGFEFSSPWQKLARVSGYSVVIDKSTDELATYKQCGAGVLPKFADVCTPKPTAPPVANGFSCVDLQLRSTQTPQEQQQGKAHYIVTSGPHMEYFDLGPVTGGWDGYEGKANNFLVWEVVPCNKVGNPINGEQYCFATSGEPVVSSGAYKGWVVPAGVIWRAGRFQTDGNDFQSFHFDNSGDHRFILGYLPYSGSIGWNAMTGTLKTIGDSSCHTNPSQGNTQYGLPKCIGDMQADKNFAPSQIQKGKHYLVRLMSAVADSTSPKFIMTMGCYQTVFTAQ